MKQFLIILFCSFSLIGFSQASYDSSKVSPLIRKMIASIEAKAVLQKESIVFLQDFSLLWQQAERTELLQLVNHPNPTIRLNSFNCLLTAAYPKFVDIVEQHLQDTATAYLQTSGDIMNITNVIEGMWQLISHNNNWIGMFPFSEADNKRLAAL